MYPLFATSFLYGAFSYLIGSIPTGYLITRFFAGIDVRLHGSGNIGATNVSRLLGKKFFFLVLLLDACKSFAVLRFVQSQTTSEHIIMFCALAVLLGNCYSIFLCGDGGKGGATLFGITCAVSSLLGIYFFAVWFFVYITSKINAVATLVASCSVPLVAWYFDLYPLLFLCASILVCVRHKDNIRQLYNNYTSSCI